MTEESKDNKDPEDLSDSEDFSLDENDTDWGDAWESAFESEEDAGTTEEDETEDFYLEDAEDVDDSATTVITPPGSVPQPTPATDSSAAITTGSTSSGLVISLRIPPFFTKFSPWITYLKGRYQSLQPKQKIILGGGCAIIFLAVMILFSLSPEETPPSPQEQITQPGELISGSGASLSTPVPSPQKPPLEIIDMPEKVRKKWTFPSFFIPVSSQKADKSITFVVIDITLLILLDEGQEIPEAQKTFVRDIIYQFYINRPLYELRRFSLARGDMNRALRAWLQKQWPEGAIEAISFKRYLLT